MYRSGALQGRRRPHAPRPHPRAQPGHPGHVGTGRARRQPHPDGDRRRSPSPRHAPGTRGARQPRVARPTSDLHALAIFVGPQSYITPSWYKTKRETGKVVPTWNYAVVHAHGPLGIVEDRSWLRKLVERLTRAHEAGRQPAWSVTDAPADFIDQPARWHRGYRDPHRAARGQVEGESESRARRSSRRGLRPACRHRRRHPRMAELVETPSIRNVGKWHVVSRSVTGAPDATSAGGLGLRGPPSL